jgi:hypothetical protein
MKRRVKRPLLDAQQFVGYLMPSDRNAIPMERLTLDGSEYQ